MSSRPSARSRAHASQQTDWISCGEGMNERREKKRRGKNSRRGEREGGVETMNGRAGLVYTVALLWEKCESCDERNFKARGEKETPERVRTRIRFVSFVDFKRRSFFFGVGGGGESRKSLPGWICE